MDEVVMEIETDKTALPVMSPGHGKIVKFLVKDGDKVKSLQPVFQVGLLSLVVYWFSDGPEFDDLPSTVGYTGSRIADVV